MTLCTLTKTIVSSDTSQNISIPIARSYNGHQWEKSAGEYAASVFSNNDILCYDIGCQINLPSLESGEEFRLSSFKYSLSRIDEVARFLETATFGITQDQLDVFDASTNNLQKDIIDWVSDQMNTTTTPITSHREFWRKGLNGRVSLPKENDCPCNRMNFYT